MNSCEWSFSKYPPACNELKHNSLINCKVGKIFALGISICWQTSFVSVKKKNIHVKTLTYAIFLIQKAIYWTKNECEMNAKNFNTSVKRFLPSINYILLIYFIHILSFTLVYWRYAMVQSLEGEFFFTKHKKINFSKCITINA